MTDATEPPVTLTFNSSHHTFWAEELARERSLPVDLISAPATARDKCGLALRIERARVSELEDACRDAGIHFQRLASS